MQGNARETRPEPERNQTPNATAKRKTHKKAKPPQMPESHTPNRISQPHTLTSCEPSFASGALSPLLSAVFLRYYYLYCSSILYFALYTICHYINYIKTKYYNYLL
nr:MAG TPA: hypothetical protein [Caudoviricetes sp.]